MKALTAAEMREVDRLTTERCDISSFQLMEAAGKSVCDAILLKMNGSSPQMFPANIRICILCGKGNNGGDGLVAARYLRLSGAEPAVLLFAAPSALIGDPAENLKRWRDTAGTLLIVDSEAAWQNNLPLVTASHVIVDALLGTGLRGAPSGLMARAIQDVNRLSGNATSARPALIVAVDTPSGLPSDGEAANGALLRAHHTVTFAAPKFGQLISRDAAACGSLQVCDIGSPLSLIDEVAKGTARWCEPREFAALPLMRAADSNKGSYGHVLLVAGSLGKSGAAILAGRMALRAGAGLVTVATPATVLPVVAAGQPEFMTEGLPSTKSGTMRWKSMEKKRWQKIASGKTVIAIGPGLGQHPQTQRCIRHIVAKTELPIILDADGLNAFAGNADALRERSGKFLAVTPHPGEMARLLACSVAEVQRDRLPIAKKAAKRWNAHVILKGFHTIVASPAGNAFINTTGNAGLAKGGTGDVLTGLLAALTAQFKTDDWTTVLALGVYLHGRAAELAAVGADLSGFLAGDLTEMIARARANLLSDLRSS